jgi:predicted pyridoxine 5'-phosphate oxidase superfamily flavin-nucleotide-binding protein
LTTAPTTPPEPIADEEALRCLYHPAMSAVMAKEITTIDEEAAGFIARSPFVVIASSGPDGADASPRGGAPGFVRVLVPETGYQASIWEHGGR